MNSNSKITIGTLEALLFHYGEAITVSKAAELLGRSEDECEKFFLELQDSLMKSERGVMLLHRDKEYQLVTRPEFKFVHEKLVTSEFKEELTPVATEALALIAYLGPISRVMIDFIRGVNSTFTLRSLFMRGLIERSLHTKGSGLQYQVSFDFLRHLGITSVEQLPDYAIYREALTKFQEASKQMNS